MTSNSKKIIQATDLPDTKWKTSTFCANNCVRVAKVGQQIAVGDSKNPNGAVLLFTKDEWRDFVAGVKNNEFE